MRTLEAIVFDFDGVIADSERLHLQAYQDVLAPLGLALAAIVRRTAGAISTLFAVVLVLPLLTRALPSPWDTDIGKFLPAELGAAMFHVRPDSGLLSPGTALVVALVWLAVAFTIAAVLLTRRDG